MEYLYHFTTTRGLAGLIAEGNNRRGKMVDPAGALLEQGAVSLTSDHLANGHGLPDGREITDQQAIGLGYAIERDGKKYCADRTEYRLKIQCDDLPLVSAVQYYEANPLMLKTLAVTAFYPVGEADDPANFEVVERQILDPKIWGRAHTWWYCFAEIPEQFVVGVAQRIAGTEDYRDLTVPEIREQLNAYARSLQGRG